MIKNRYIYYEHDRWCIYFYTTDQETIHVATLKLKDATIPYCSKNTFESFRCVLGIKVNIRHLRIK